MSLRTRLQPKLIPPPEGALPVEEDSFGEYHLRWDCN